MKLRTKVMLIVGSMWAIALVGIWIDSRFMLSANYAQLENQDVEQDLIRAKNALQNKVAALATLNADWSQWDDAYRFMADKNQKFIQTNLIAPTYKNAQIDFIFFFTPSGALLFGQAYNAKLDKLVPIPTSLLQRLKTLSWLKHPSKKHSGLIAIPEGTLLVSFSPILDSEGGGPTHGTLMMGYFLNQKFIDKISQTVELKANIFPLSVSNSLVDPNVLEQLQSDKSNVIAPKNKNYIYGFSYIRDIEGNPISILQIETERNIYNEGITTVNHYLIIVTTLGIAIMVLMWWLLKKVVVDRIIRVSKQLIDINFEHAFSKRIPVHGDDAIDQMATVINTLLEIIKLSEEELKYRISERTTELEKLAVVNRNLYSEMNQQKAIASQLQKGEKLLRKIAYFDNLTGLPNRLFFNDLLANAIKKAEHDQSQIAVLFLDADKFKSINDTYGHLIGDNYLMQVAHLMQKSIKGIDTLARLGGDEFIFFVSNVKDKHTINLLATRLLHDVAVPFHIENKTIHSTFSIGISLYPQDGKTVELLTKHADLAMYYAKKQAGNTYFYYDSIGYASPAL